MAFEAEQRSFRFLAPVPAQLNGPVLPSRSVDVGWSPSRSRSSRGARFPNAASSDAEQRSTNSIDAALPSPFEEGRR